MGSLCYLDYESELSLIPELYFTQSRESRTWKHSLGAIHFRRTFWACFCRLLIFCGNDRFQISTFPPLLVSVTICSIISSRSYLLSFGDGDFFDVAAIHHPARSIVGIVVFVAVVEFVFGGDGTGRSTLFVDIYLSRAVLVTNC